MKHSKHRDVMIRIANALGSIPLPLGTGRRTATVESCAGYSRDIARAVEMSCRLLRDATWASNATDWADVMYDLGAMEVECARMVRAARGQNNE